MSVTPHCRCSYFVIPPTDCISFLPFRFLSTQLGFFDQTKLFHFTPSFAVVRWKWDLEVVRYLNGECIAFTGSCTDALFIQIAKFIHKVLKIGWHRFNQPIIESSIWSVYLFRSSIFRAVIYHVLNIMIDGYPGELKRKILGLTLFILFYSMQLLFHSACRYAFIPLKAAWKSSWWIWHTYQNRSLGDRSDTP